ncbi:MAG: hypothetical protein SOT09_04240 [Candidatus Borkfalkiaceae bacterium]|nr:hypothetical protein [Christensenellaceae bacterium]
MRKIFSGVISAVMATTIIFGLTGCLGKPVNPGSNAEGKKEIFVSLYDGGYGTDWFTPVKEEFEKDYPDYYVSVEKKKRTVAQIEQLIALGQQADMYVSTVSDFHTLIYSDKLEDISDVLDMKVDGETRTIGEKILDKELWKTIGSKDGKGLYMLPFEDGITGFNYDHQKFVEYGLMIEASADDVTRAALTEQGIEYTETAGKLIFKRSASETNYNEGDVILRAGKDGKFGTYDDGQPITMSEWNQMFLLLKGLGKAVIYPGKILDYTTDIFNGVFAQYDGLDNWKLFNTYDGAYTFDGDSAPTKITMQNGYEVFGMTGIRKATEFMQTYLNNRDYAHESAFMSEESNTDAQGKFVVGSAKNSVDAPFTGLMVEGIWWEKEAKPAFDGLTEDPRYSDYKYGTRDYRIMLYPQMDGQKGADGNGNGSVLATRAAGSCIVTKNDDADILEKTKILLAYTMKDEYLRYFTKTTGVVRAFDYELTSEDKASMTKYARNVWELYRDGENVKFVRPLLDRYLTALPYKTSKGYNVNWYSKVDDVSYNMPISALRAAEKSLDKNVSSDPVGSAFKGFKAHFGGMWQQYINELKLKK